MVAIPLASEKEADFFVAFITVLLVEKLQKDRAPYL